MAELRPGTQVSGPFGPEPVRVLHAEAYGDVWRLVVVGEKSGRSFRKRWFRSEDLSRLTIIPAHIPNFTRRPEAVFLALEAPRIHPETIPFSGAIQVLGVAAVLPRATEEALAPDPEVEGLDMETVWASERAQGRNPVDVSRENLGYDVRSEGAGEVRSIEVKARAKPGSATLTQHEWLMAHRLGKEYWLHVVTLEPEGPWVWTLCNPARLPAERKTVVRFLLGRRKHGEGS